jgi:hypothetical protein
LSTTGLARSSYQWKQLDGVVSWNNLQSMAHVSGTLNENAKTFQMNAIEQGGQNRTATITGTVEAMEISSPASCHGAKC